jgi:hypothetical protein
MNKWLRWEKGCQQGSYSKILLVPEFVSRKFNFDLYILKFPKGCSVPKHRDPVESGYCHYRVNFTFWNKSGGRMYILGPIKRIFGFEIFRPDLYEHGLQTVNENMFMLSFGLKLKERKNG